MCHAVELLTAMYSTQLAAIVPSQTHFIMLEECADYETCATKFVYFSENILLSRNPSLSVQLLRNISLLPGAKLEILMIINLLLFHINTYYFFHGFDLSTQTRYLSRGLLVNYYNPLLVKYWPLRELNGSSRQHGPVACLSYLYFNVSPITKPVIFPRVMMQRGYTSKM